MVASFLHELAHYRLGHIESDLDKETKEVEAETVSFIVTSYLGLKNEKSQYYIGYWNGQGDNLIGKGSKLISCAESIIKDLNALIGDSND